MICVMSVLSWIGKEKVMNHHLEVSFRVLEHRYGYTGTMQVSERTETGNKIIHGDNLEALKSLLPEYEGKIKCVYIDPPYNTGKEGWVYNDNVNHPKIKKWLHETVGKEGEDFSRHDKWLCMMYPRLKLLHRLLSPNGVIIVSIDDNEQPSLRFLLDEIFGSGNMLVQGVVNKASEIASAFTISRHEYYTVYAKSVEYFSVAGNDKFTVSRGTVGNEKQTMPVIVFPKGLRVLNLDDGVYETSRKIINSNENIQNLDPFIVKDGRLAENVRLKARWRSSNDMRNFFANNCQPVKAKINGIIEEIYFDGDRFMPYIKKRTTQKISSLYLENKRGSLDLEKLGMGKTFENPKSVQFITYLLSFFTAENDIVLDSFAGSGTTGHAVLNLNKQDQGNRKFILIEMLDYAEYITAERIKRVVQKLHNESEPYHGFDFFTVGQTFFSGEYQERINEDISTGEIRKYIWYSETRSDYFPPENNESKYFLGSHAGAAYYFFYEKHKIMTLDFDLLSEITVKSDQYILYADNCLLPEDFMTDYNIVFKKIPGEIARF